MKKKYSWQTFSAAALCAVLAIFLLALIFVTAYAHSMLSKINRESDDGTLSLEDLASIMADDDSDLDADASDYVTIDDPDDVTLATASDVIASDGVIQVMLIGQDRRAGETYRTRSDAMILVTVDTTINSVTLTSFMRDLYVSIPGYSNNKLNAAYPFGGLSLLSETLALNFGVQVDDFLVCDFTGFPEVIDILGGVSIELTSAEASYLNSNFGYSLSAGTTLLTGEQALNYSRIRYIGTDVERTNRQRKVISSIIESCRSITLSQALELANEFLPCLSTNMTNEEIISLVTQLYPLLADCTIVSQRIPYDGSYYFATISGMSVVVADLEANQQYLIDTLSPSGS
ncbi:MAG: LCP family protein [Firmicutes bacterium]|nr:LCP family protein [Bacillota bacterium]